jgi:replicative DNA helicase
MRKAEEVVTEYLARKELERQDPEKYRGIKTGIADLDETIRGLHYGWLVYFAAQRKVGKTSTMVTLSKSFAAQGLKFLRISLEEDEEQIIERQLSNEARVNRPLLRELEFSEAQWQDVLEAGVRIKKWEMLVDSNADTVEKIESLVKDTDIRIILIDMIHLMSDRGHESNTAEVAAISRKLKKLTRLNGKGMLVIVAAQLNDNDDYLQSRGLGRDADLAVKMYKQEDATGAPIENRVTIEVADSRHSGYCKFDAYFDGAQSLIGALEKPITINDLI